ncbi:hypothetical protein DFJ58DRAFT_849330 [Suillus subalutaceus]|uniref:uncharacterized protein n=1 Tax=Suillus subalutaceus TaxID=48586 RepID=UPI001B86D497|nr:uncharacterized protein DFJ58DRAFT_849330 [Suillus subalutaceus]KAG1827841.1 hypothetical protein DFJ58DRAFT_849330 [Suillus subalutaceus]
MAQAIGRPSSRFINIVHAITDVTKYQPVLYWAKTEAYHARLCQCAIESLPRRYHNQAILTLIPVKHIFTFSFDRIGGNRTSWSRSQSIDRRSIGAALMIQIETVWSLEAYRRACQRSRRSHLKSALSLSMLAGENHLRALLLAQVGVQYLHTAPAHAMETLAVYETLGTGLGSKQECCMSYQRRSQNRCGGATNANCCDVAYSIICHGNATSTIAEYFADTFEGGRARLIVLQEVYGTTRCIQPPGDGGSRKFQQAMPRWKRPREESSTGIQ